MGVIEQTAIDLLAVLPLLNRIIASEVRREGGEETTMSQFRCLALLAEGPMTLSTLARKRRVSLQSMGEQVQTLVERGWIRRTPDPSDRRQQQLQLTEEGRQHYGRTHDRTVQHLLPLLTRMDPDELALVRAALPVLQRVLLSDDEPVAAGSDR